MRKTTCRCGNPVRSGARNCLACHAAAMRKFRHSHPLTPEQRHKDNCRSYAGVYLRRGILELKPCEDCGSTESQMHHDDYDKPLEVRWKCRPCHLAHHLEHAF